METRIQRRRRRGRVAPTRLAADGQELTPPVRTRVLSNRAVEIARMVGLLHVRSDSPYLTMLSRLPGLRKGTDIWHQWIIVLLPVPAGSCRRPGTGWRAAPVSGPWVYCALGTGRLSSPKAARRGVCGHVCAWAQTGMLPLAPSLFACYPCRALPQPGKGMAAGRWHSSVPRRSARRDFAGRDGLR